MQVHSGRSFREDSVEAIDEATMTWAADLKPEIVFAFASTKQDAGAVARTLAERYPNAIVVGCSTTGEHVGGEHSKGALALTALCESGVRWAATVIRGLASFDDAGASVTTRSLFGDLGVNVDDFAPEEFFCLWFIDGLRAKEEVVGALIADALEGVRLVGGSAGDDLAFKQTVVIYGGEAITDAAVLLMGHAKGRFEILKHQHFTTTTRRLVVTKVDAAERRIYEIDGLPAVEAYANALGLATDAVTSDVTFMNPVTFSCNGEIYVRSVQRLEPDGSMVFFCAVEEGMVLEIGSHHDMCASLASDFERITARGPFDFMLGFNCILRALEADKIGAVDRLGELWRGAARSSLGFDTYGEVLDGIHINQTLVAIGLRATVEEQQR